LFPDAGVSTIVVIAQRHDTLDIFLRSVILSDKVFFAKTVPTLRRITVCDSLTKTEFDMCYTAFLKTDFMIII